MTSVAFRGASYSRTKSNVLRCRRRGFAYIDFVDANSGLIAEKSHNVRRVIPPPVLFFVCLILGMFLQHVRPLPIAGYSFGAGIAVGTVALVLAVVLAAGGIREMRRHGTPIEPGRIPARLVTSGPFRFSRNPLYVALLLVLAGIAIMGNSLWLAAGTGALFLLLDRLVVVREEAMIQKAFGPEYSNYAARVRRWL